MLENLRRNWMEPIILFGVGLFTISLFLYTGPSFMLYLTVAQLIYVPILLHCILKLNRWDRWIIGIGMVGIIGCLLLPNEVVKIVGAGLYVISTGWFALKGLKRFFHRGFTNLSEIAIDVALIYLLIGGLWHFAYIAEIDTGFTPIITWLTAIHFHYSGFLLNVSVGLIGRVYKGKGYTFVASSMMAGLMLVAIGITFSTIVEVVSVLLYIAGIYLLFALTFKIALSKVQKLLLQLSIGTLVITIVWSLLYAISNLTATYFITIPNMLQFHGWLNCIFFGSLTVITWTLYTPKTNEQPFVFPVSKIRGKFQVTGVRKQGLVDDLSELCSIVNVPETIREFYEGTERFTLKISVKWLLWFKPFALIYKMFSRKIQQINLPLTKRWIEMSGELLEVDERLDGREKPRVWIRKVDDQTVFTAIYSIHHSDQTYMNIALPLPFSTMIGILSVNECNEQLHLTSNAAGDAGTYLAVGKCLFQLPIHEHFVIEEREANQLVATHRMHIFGLPFLHIDYEIFKMNPFNGEDINNGKEVMYVD